MDKKIGKIFTDNVAIRSEPNPTSSIVARVDANHRVTVIGEKGAYLEVETIFEMEKIKGWVSYYLVVVE